MKYFYFQILDKVTISTEIYIEATVNDGWEWSAIYIPKQNKIALTSGIFTAVQFS